MLWTPHAKSFRKQGGLPVRHTAELAFDFRDCVLANVLSQAAAARGKHRLGQTALVADSPDHWAHDILPLFAAH